MRRALLSIFLLTIFIPNMAGAETLDECTQRIKRQYISTRQLQSNPEYMAVFDALKAQDQQQFNNTLDMPIVGVPPSGTCTVNGHVFEYNCRNHISQRTCFPKECWPMLYKSDAALHIDANKKFINDKIASECADVNGQTAAQDRQDARDENRAIQDENRAAAQASKATAKEEECAKKTPAQVAKKNALGMWVCVDSDETKAQREQAKANNKTLKSFSDEMDNAHDAFTKQIKKLTKK